MNLYLLSQRRNTGYDTYDSCVVCAESPDDAITIHPMEEHYKGEWWKDDDGDFGGWAKPQWINCKRIGSPVVSIPRGVICASFNAG